MQTLYMMVAVDARRAEEAGTSRANTISKLTIPHSNSLPPITIQAAVS